MDNTLKNTAAFNACENLYLNEKFSDVHFVFGIDDEIEKVPAHKIKLAVLSSVFERMFYGSLPEKGDVRITDADADGFKEFLQFFYLGDLTLTMENIETVVRLADKYDVLEYVNACAVFLKSQLTVNNMFWGYQLAANLKNKQLIEFCEDKIIRSPKEIFATDVFQRCDKTILTRILDLDLACNEAEVFDACSMWAKNACKKDGLDETQSVNLRNQLGDCLKQIRFGVMKIDVFNQRYMQHKGLFTLEEFEDIMLSITVKEYKPKIFNKIPRLNHVDVIEFNHTWNADKILECSRTTSGRVLRKCTSIQTSEVTSFSSNHLVLLGEIRTAHTHGSLVDIKSTEIKVIITERESITFDPNVQLKVVYKGTSGTWDCDRLKVILSHPILIQPRRMYEIRLDIQSIGQCWYSENYKQIVEMGNGIQIEFYRNPTLNYNNLMGWISNLFFIKI